MRPEAPVPESLPTGCLAVVATGLSLIIRLLLMPWLGYQAPFITFSRPSS